MADSPKGGDEPNLELPSLFRRKKKQREEPVSNEPATLSDVPDPTPETPTPVAPPPAAASPAATSPAESAPDPLFTDQTPDEQPLQPTAEDRREHLAPPTRAERVKPPAVSPATPSEGSPVASPVASPAGSSPEQPADDPTSVLPAARSSKAERPAKSPKPQKPAKAAKAPREHKPFVLPTVDPRIAAALAGLVAGLVTVFLEFAAASSCELIRGVGSCGGLGLFLLLGILAVAVVVGGVLLTGWKIPDPMSTSFLGVGIVAVVVMLFFLEHLESPWMIAVIPLLMAIAFLGSWWVTVNLIHRVDDGPVLTAPETDAAPAEDPESSLHERP